MFYPTRTQERPKFGPTPSKTMLDSKIKVLFSAIPIAILIAVMVIAVLSTTNLALAQTSQSTFFESAVNAASQGTENATQTALQSAEPAPATAGGAEAAGQERMGGGAAAAAVGLLRQGQISSSISEVPERDDSQVAVIVPPRDDNAVLSGILTYQASRPVDLFVWNNVEFENTTAIPEEFGELDDIVNIGDKTFALAEVGSGSSSSVPFTGNAIEAVGDDEPFIVTYSLNAFPAIADLVSDLRSLNTFNATAEESDGDEE